MTKWYSQNLGIQLEPWGGAILKWTDDKSEDHGLTVWHVADKNTEWFSPSPSTFMINYRIDNMSEMLADLKRNGVEIWKGPEPHENGKFAWILDPDGNKVAGSESPRSLFAMRLHQPYRYGNLGCMKKTLHIDDRLLRDARSASGARTDTDTVRLGLEALIRRGAYERLRALRGSEPTAQDTPRRRQRVRATKCSARHSAA